jgi:hypothetical protein
MDYNPSMQIPTISSLLHTYLGSCSLNSILITNYQAKGRSITYLHRRDERENVWRKITYVHERIQEQFVFVFVFVWEIWDMGCLGLEVYCVAIAPILIVPSGNVI